jgi:hypothetical protein
MQSHATSGNSLRADMDNRIVWEKSDSNDSRLIICSSSRLCGHTLVHIWDVQDFNDALRADPVGTFIAIAG